MKQKSHKDTMGYYSTLLQQYKVDDNLLDNRVKKRAIGSVLEQIDKKKVQKDQKLDRARLKKLRRAFGNNSWFKKVAASLTFATALALFQAPPAEANTSTTYISKAKANYVSVKMDEDGTNIAQQKEAIESKTLETTSLHFSTNKASFNKYEMLEENSVLLDDDSDVAYTPPSQGNHLTVIDTTIEDWQTLAKSVKEGSILLLKKDDNPLDTILTELKKLKSLDSLNIISHGSSGELHFSDKKISKESLELNKTKWEELGKYLSKEGDINLFGCNVAQGEEGKEFIETLAKLTSADVAGSINPTGNESQGGDWKLEVIVGQVENKRVFTQNILKSFNHILQENESFESGWSSTPAQSISGDIDGATFVISSDIADGKVYQYSGASYASNGTKTIYLKDQNGIVGSHPKFSIKRDDNASWTLHSLHVNSYSNSSGKITPYLNGSAISGQDKTTTSGSKTNLTWSGGLTLDELVIVYNDTGSAAMFYIDELNVTATVAPSNNAPTVDLDANDSTTASSGGAIRRLLVINHDYTPINKLSYNTSINPFFEMCA